MNLYVFNPEHDLALAQDDKNFTAPHAGSFSGQTWASYLLFGQTTVILCWLIISNVHIEAFVIVENTKNR